MLVNEVTKLCMCWTGHLRFSLLQPLCRQQGCTATPCHPVIAASPDRHCTYKTYVGLARRKKRQEAQQKPGCNHHDMVTQLCAPVQTEGHPMSVQAHLILTPLFRQACRILSLTSLAELLTGKYLLSASSQARGIPM